MCAVIVVFSTAAVFRPFAKQADYVVINHENVISEHSLKTDAKINAGNTVIIINEGKAMISESTCSHKICRNAGWLSKTGDVSACVPNRVMIEIQGRDNKYDAVSK